ncbi:uncharacterized protein A4U43_C02F22690 [Asparagus officinalis]|uniref:BHLH domain-containing protein n=1 Tax=Asparagus officinalis TaxID=4686 RepID=A0A5P1FM53_ASPOF|nr:transcription factor PIF3-like [Asparagus officinalis]ONK78813.1 uncharacterized protein A4U43_C02F22690 [Asparagus officinalis]
MSLPKPPKEGITVDESKVICEGESSRKNNKYNTGNADSRSPERVQSSSFAASAALPEKRNEAVVVSSCASLSSSEDAESNDNKHRGKRKHQEGEESGYHSEDLEYESIELKKSLPVQGKSKKRSRAAEVHNLSEKRRRDRINERMRALQELIPNCNKTDKASMLDEAIEYLKSLQMQLQIMAMRSGLCMPPMMMQHMRAPTMAPMGIGMGMGMGLSYGMGMYDVNVSRGCSFIPVQGPQFPCSSIPGSQGVHPSPAGSNNFQMFGIPGTGFPVPLPYRPPSTTTEDAKRSPDATMTVGNQHEQNKTLEKT